MKAILARYLRLSRGERIAWAVLAGALLLTLVFLVAKAPAQIGVTPDTKDYIQHYPYRTSGYPLFIRLVGQGRLLAVQIGLYWAALAALAACIVARTRNVWLALATLALIAANPFVFDNVTTIGSEALWLPVLIALMALTLQFAARPGLGLAVAMGIAVGLLCATRPTGWALTVALGLAVLALAPQAWRARLTLLGAALAPVVLFVAADGIYCRAIHGPAITSLAGEHLYAKASLLDAPPAPLPDDPAARRLAEAFDGPMAEVRRAIAAAPNGASRVRLGVAYENCIAVGCADTAHLTGVAHAAENRTLFALGKARALRNLPGLAAEDWRDYWADWSVFHDPALVPAFNDYVARARLPYRAELGDALIPVMKSRIGGVGNLAFQVLALITLAETLALAWLAVSRRRVEPVLGLALTSAALVQGTILMSALTAPSVSRFLISVWPALVMACTGLAYAALQTPRARALLALRPGRWSGR